MLGDQLPTRNAVRSPFALADHLNQAFRGLFCGEEVVAVGAFLELPEEDGVVELRKILLAHLDTVEQAHFEGL